MKAGIVALVAAASMAATPALAAEAVHAPAQSLSAQSLSIAKARAAAPARKGEQLLGIGNRFLIGAVVTAAIVAGIFIAADQIGSDDPDGADSN